MHHPLKCLLFDRLGAVAALSLAAAMNVAAASPTAYRSINPIMADQTVVLTGRDLTIEQVVQVARYGAKVVMGPEALQRSAWLDLRKQQNPSRAFGAMPTAVWTAFRATLPFDGAGRSSATQTIHEIASTFIRSNAAANFYKDGTREPDRATHGSGVE